MSDIAGLGGKVGTAEFGDNAFTAGSRNRERYRVCDAGGRWRLVGSRGQISGDFCAPAG